MPADLVSRGGDPSDEFGMAFRRPADHEERGMSLPLGENRQEAVGQSGARSVVVGQGEASGLEEGRGPPIRTQPDSDADPEVEAGKDSRGEDGKQGFGHVDEAFACFLSSMRTPGIRKKAILATGITPTEGVDPGHKTEMR